MGDVGKGSPPYEGGVDAASADGVVLWMAYSCAGLNPDTAAGLLWCGLAPDRPRGEPPLTSPDGEVGPLLRKEGSPIATSVNPFVRVV